MSAAVCGQREACWVCGSTEWHDAHFVAGRLLCLPCWREIEASKPTTPPAQTTLADWLAPQSPRRSPAHE